MPSIFLSNFSELNVQVLQNIDADFKTKILKAYLP